MASASGLKKPKPRDARLPSKPSKDLPSCSPAASRLLFELSPVELIDITAGVLQQRIDANDALLRGHKQQRSEITRFHTRDPPAISVKAYLARLLQLAPFPLDALLLAVVYINRLTHREVERSSRSKHFQALFPQSPPPSISTPTSWASINLLLEASPAPPLTPWTVHRLTLGTLAIAAKYTSDAYIGQRRLAKVGGVSVKELYELEIEIFDQLSWSCYCPAAELESVCSQLWQLCAKCEHEEQPTSQSDSLLASADRLHLERLSLSPQNYPRQAVSPTPAMSDADSESSGMASSVDDSGTVDASHLSSTCEQVHKSLDRAPALVPMPLR